MMKSYATIFAVLLCCTLGPQISAKPYYRRPILSDIEHHPYGGHDVRFDHEAFLGKEEAARFDQLSTEDSAGMLSLIFDKVDESNDGLINVEEMKNWIERIHFVHLLTEAKKEFAENGGKDDRMSYENYSKEAFLEPSTVVPEDLEEYHRQKTQARAKWTAADKDQDGFLTLNEYVAFSNPVEFKHMHDHYVRATLEDMDSDGNGLVTTAEFAKNRWKDDSEGVERPIWLKEEIETMTRYFDTNKDGVFDLDEFYNWLLPKDHNPYLAEALHLISHADDNKDKMLTREEMLNAQSIFVGSDAAPYRHVWRHHEEL